MKRKRIPTRFRLPYTDKQVYTMLYASCKAEVNARMREFIASDEYKKHIWEISKWLTSNDSTFGLFLSGDKGNGKTTIIKALQSLYTYLHSDETSFFESSRYEKPYKGFRIITAKDLVQLAKAYNNQAKENTEDTEEYKKIKNIEVLCIDDLGAEPRESIHYGDIITAVTDVIMYRYQEQFCTITTSNLSADEIGTYYDQRLSDRLKEMAHVVNFNKEPSFRDLKTYNKIAKSKSK